MFHFFHVAGMFIIPSDFKSYFSEVIILSNTNQRISKKIPVHIGWLLVYLPLYPKMHDLEWTHNLYMDYFLGCPYFKKPPITRT